MSRFWNDRTNDLVPYVPGEQPGAGEKWIKINTNENPYPPSPKVFEAIKKHCNDELRLYPSPDVSVLRGKMAAFHGLSPENVFFGNGSDEVLGFAFQAFFDDKRNVLCPEISYSFYPVYCNLFGIPYTKIPLKPDYTIDTEAFVNTKGGVVIANPNAPTSICLNKEEIIKILCAHRDDVVVIDEAYVDFGGESVVSLIKEYDNLLVVQTMSKSRALAGMRIGFALGSKELIQGLERVKNSFNSYTMDRLSIAAAQAAIEDSEYYKDICCKIMATRERVAGILLKMGFDCPPSASNFLFIEHKEYRAEEIFMYLKNNGVLVRYFKTPGIDNRLRVTIGTEDEMDVFLEVLGRFIKEKEGLL